MTASLPKAHTAIALTSVPTHTATHRSALSADIELSSISSTSATAVSDERTSLFSPRASYGSSFS